MSLLGKLFSQKAGAAVAVVEKKITKDLVEGVISGSLLVAFADGTCDDSELTALETVLGLEDSFKPWSGEFNDMITKYAGQLQKAFRLGRMNALKELSDLRSRPEDAELVLTCILTIADEGGISDDERKVLGEIASALGLNLSKYL